MGLRVMWKRTGRRRPVLWLALVLALIACIPLMGPGIVNTRAGGDSPFLLQRLHQLLAGLRGGQFPVRWMPDAAYGLGYPFFNFYASLPYYVAAVFSLLGGGYTAALKLTQVLGMLAAAGGMYGFARRVLRDEAAAFLSAVMYAYAPFHLVNLYVRGDSLSEYWAFSFYPVILWALFTLSQRPSLRKSALLALAYGGLVLTHNVSTMIFTPFAVLYGLMLLLGRSDGRCRFIRLGLIGAVLGLVWSSWFWGPALLERGYVQLEEMATGYFHYTQHFRQADLVQWRPVFDYTINGHQTPFSMGLLQALVAVGGVIAIVASWLKLRHVDGQSLSACLMLLIATWMITPWSAAVWDNMPLLQLAQFPWRFLSVQAFACAWVAGLLAVRVKGRLRHWWVVLALATLIVVCALAGLRPERLYIADSEVTTERLRLYEVFTGNIGSTVRHEYLPRAVVPRPYTSRLCIPGRAFSDARVLRGQVGSLERLSPEGSASQRWAVEVLSDEAVVVFPTHYYPGWRAAVDGLPSRLDPAEGTGFLRLALPKGEHGVKLFFGRTRKRAALESISLVGLLVLVVLLRPRHWQCVLRHAAIGLGLLAVLALAFRAGAILVPRIGDSDDLTMDFSRLPYLHHNPRGVSFESGIRLLNYSYSKDMLGAGDELVVALEWSGRADPSQKADLMLLGPTQHLFGVSFPYCESVQSLSGGRTIHHMAVPPDAPPGEYLLAIKVLGEEGEIRPVNPRGETLGTLYLRPLMVVAGRHPDAGQASVGDFGPAIALIRVESEHTAEGDLHVRLTWRCRELLNRRYRMSLRLKDSRGKVVVSKDLPPFYGAYPTNLWQPGDEMTDLHLLSLPEELAPGSDYELEVILYDFPSLAPIGSAVVPDVAVTRPSASPVSDPGHQS